MKKLGKKLMSLAMVGTLVAAPISVSAETTYGDMEALNGAMASQLTGDAELEAAIATTIYEVEVPTDAVTEAVLAMKLDPQQLVYQSVQAGQAKDDYEGLSIDPDATVLFANYDGTDGENLGTLTGYSATSDKLEIVNKSSEPVAVTLTPTYAGSNFALVDSFTENAEGAELSLTVSTQGGDAVAVQNGVGLEPVNLEAAPYEIIWDGSKYVKQIPEGTREDRFGALELQVTGAINTNTTYDWTELNGEDVSIDESISFAYTFAEGTKSVGTVASFIGTKTIGTITIDDKGTDDYAFASFVKLTATLSDGTQSADLLTASDDWDAASVTTSKITLSSGAKTYLATKVDDTSAVPVTIKYKTTNGKIKTTTATLKVK